MNTRFILISLLFITATAPGCNRMSKREVQEGWTATMLAMTFAGAGTASLDAPSRVDRRGDGSDTVECQDGGSMAVSILDGDDWLIGSARFEFDGCASMGVIIDGDITYTFEYSSDLTSFSLDYVGDVSWSGSVVGTCEFDVHITADQSSADVSGEVCGRNAGRAGIGP